MMGLIDREALFDIVGRSRRRQIELARKFGITDYPNSAGGCLLTEPGFSRKVRDLFEHEPDPDLSDTELLKVGRHFRLTDRCKLVLGRDQRENARLEALSRDGDIRVEVMDHVGPFGLLRGKASEVDVTLAARIVLSYSDAPRDRASVVRVAGPSLNLELTTTPLGEPARGKYRI